ncbi:MAG: hypothetical protein U0N20_06595 [Clostridium sp.]
MKNSEFGGYLPLEISKTGEYFIEDNGYKIKRLNHGRSAILYALMELKSKIVYLPLFYCPSVIDTLKKRGYKLFFYSIDENLMPKFNRRIDENDTVILVDYYGVMNDKIKNIAKYLQCKIILDFAHDFFATPMLKDNIYNVYSCRKFFGVPDGAYLIGTGFSGKIQLQQEESYDRCLHLLKCIDKTTSSSYDLNLENEKYIGTTFNEMSKLTMHILNGINYKKIKKQREENFAVLHEALKDYQKKQSLPKKAPAYCYPLLLSKDIRNELIAKKVWIPTMWRELIRDEYLDTIEYSYSKNMVCLPIDQRYDKKDMENLANIVIKTIEEVIK